jgi:hypothetical protein
MFDFGFGVIHRADNARSFRHKSKFADFQVLAAAPMSRVIRRGGAGDVTLAS